MEVIPIKDTNVQLYKKPVPIWEKYLLTVDEAVQYFGIGEKKIRMLIAENANTEFCFTVQIGTKSLINRHKFEEFLNQTTSL
jgi:excisionase family DNA binding protein